MRLALEDLSPETMTLFPLIKTCPDISENTLLKGGRGGSYRERRKRHWHKVSGKAQPRRARQRLSSRTRKQLSKQKKEKPVHLDR